MYAGDVQIYRSGNIDTLYECIDRLNDDLDIVHNWAKANGLCLNPEKSEFLMIHRRSITVNIDLQIKINDQRISIVTSAKNLGIMLNSLFSWTDHVNYISGQIYARLRNLWSTQMLTPLPIRVPLAKSYLMPVLLYGCELFVSCDAACKRKLNLAFNNIIRLAFLHKCSTPLEYITSCHSTDKQHNAI
ncbi:uncharacterized protein LOC142224606 [Haematobia irritans]|uniref:uncharacterized protein LOC142224606 n=1 Tax=Haematobia irritans TaxID=7368 RepID=UPI003F4F538D